MSQEISVDFNPVVDFNLQGFDEVSQVNFNPGLFNRSLNFGYFDLDLFQVSNFFIEEIQIRNDLSATFKQNILSLDFLLSLYFVNFWLILFQKFAETFLGILRPEIAVLLEIFFNVFSVFNNQVQVV